MHEWSELTDGSFSQTTLETAQIAAQYHRLLDIPVYPQGEVGRALATLQVPSVACAAPGQAAATYYQLQYDSGDVCDEQVAYCRRHEITKALVIQASPRIWLQMWMYEKRGLTIILPPHLPAMVHQKNMRQWWWGTKYTAYPYELLCRLVYLVKGDI